MRRNRCDAAREARLHVLRLRAYGGLLAVRMMLRNHGPRLIDTDEGYRSYQSAYACCDRGLVGHDDHPLYR